MIDNSITPKIIPFAIVSFLYLKSPKNNPIFNRIPKVTILPNFPSYFKSCKPPKKE